jgi:hypothetical protein
VDGGSSINVTFPRMLQALGIAIDDLTDLDTPFFGIMPTKEEYPLGHIYMSVTFGTPENYQTKFLRFEVARFDCGYNAIIGRPGLTKFMVILHYSYMILKMSGPQGVIIVHADFQGVAECFWGAIQTALTAGPSVALPAQADGKLLEENFTIKLRLQPLCDQLKKLKGSIWDSLMNARLQSSVPASTTNRKARSSSSCKTIGMCSRGNLRTCQESRESWSSTNSKCTLRQGRSDRSYVVSRLSKENPFKRN